MADYATKQDVEEIVGKAVNKAVDDLSEVIAQFAKNVDDRFSKVDDRFNKVDDRFSKIDDRFNKVEAGIAELNVKYDRLLNTMDAFIERIDHYETEQAARDSQVARLERWIEQIAKETGVKLQN